METSQDLALTGQNGHLGFAVVRSGHVVIRVSDVARYRALLTSVMGLQIVREAGMTYFTANPLSNHHMIAIAGVSDGVHFPSGADQVGVVGIAYELASVEAFHKISERLADIGAQHGVEDLSVNIAEPFSVIRCRDFDGLYFEFYLPTNTSSALLEAEGVAATAGEAAPPSIDASDRERIGPILDRSRQEIRGTGYLTLRCVDVERSAEFFHEALDLQRSPWFGDAARTNDGIWLSSPVQPERPVLFLTQVASPDTAQPTSRYLAKLAHFAMEVGSFAELKLVYRHFLDRKVEIIHTDDNGISRGIYFLDPDGNEFEVYADTPRAQYRDPVDPFGRFGSIVEALEAV